ncbi:hypothetical protein ACVWW4_004237 [Bradyrhizobium sp. LB7.1]
MGLDSSSAQLLGKGQYGWMLNGRSDDLLASLLHGERGQDRGVVGFSRARGEDDLVIECGANEGLQLPARLFQRGRNLNAECMPGRRIAELPREERQHCRDHQRMCTGRRVVIQVDRPHGLSALHLRPHFGSSGGRDQADELAEPLDQARVNGRERRSRKLA